jgi:hypothetical protein
LIHNCVPFNDVECALVRQSLMCVDSPLLSSTQCSFYTSFTSRDITRLYDIIKSHEKRGREKDRDRRTERERERERDGVKELPVGL